MTREVSIVVNGKRVKVRDGITVKKALEISGYKVTKYPEKGSLFAPCEVGGCWSCAVEVNKELKPACITPAKDGLRIRTELPEDYLPKRIVQGFSGHTVGGVGTPYNKELISVQEVGLIGERLYEIDPEIQVCVLDYRPEFKRPGFIKPGYKEMVEIHKILKEKGLTTVICQTEVGHIGPEL